MKNLNWGIYYISMKFVSKNDALILKNSPTCSIFEYTIGNENINFAVAEISGRYPERGMAQNQRSTMVAYICRGGGAIHIEEEEYKISEGDAVCIEPNERYFWEGDMQIVISCTPPWNPEQYKIQ